MAGGSASPRNIVAVGVAIWFVATAACGLVRSFGSFFRSPYDGWRGRGNAQPLRQIMKQRAVYLGIFAMGGIMTIYAHYFTIWNVPFFSRTFSWPVNRAKFCSLCDRRPSGR